MNARTLLALPYKFYRVPLAVVDEQVARRLPADSGPRLVFDRALGSYDRLAGRLLGDVAVAEQGSDRIARSAKLAGAVALERDAAAHRDQAAEEIESGQRSAALKRKAAQQRLADGLDEANARERQANNGPPPRPARTPPATSSKPLPGPSNEPPPSSKDFRRPTRSPT
jgi:hypothetical protein